MATRTITNDEIIIGFLGILNVINWIYKKHPKRVLISNWFTKPESLLLSMSLPSSQPRTMVKINSLQLRLIIPPPIENTIFEMIILSIHLYNFDEKTDLIYLIIPRNSIALKHRGIARSILYILIQYMLNHK